VVVERRCQRERELGAEVVCVERCGRSADRGQPELEDLVLDGYRQLVSFGSIEREEAMSLDLRPGSRLRGKRARRADTPRIGDVGVEQHVPVRIDFERQVVTDSRIRRDALVVGDETVGLMNRECGAVLSVGGLDSANRPAVLRHDQRVSGTATQIVDRERLLSERPSTNGAQRIQVLARRQLKVVGDMVGSQQRLVDVVTPRVREPVAVERPARMEPRSRAQSRSPHELGIAWNDRSLVHLVPIDRTEAPETPVAAIVDAIVVLETDTRAPPADLVERL
jgi:hypothetical protein